MDGYLLALGIHFLLHVLLVACMMLRLYQTTLVRAQIFIFVGLLVSFFLSVWDLFLTLWEQSERKRNGSVKKQAPMEGKSAKIGDDELRAALNDLEKATRYLQAAKKELDELNRSAAALIVALKEPELNIHVKKE